jgi:hypothetical protein
MSAKFWSSVHRRIERQWALRIKLLRKIQGKIVVETKRALQRVLKHHDALIPIPVRVSANRRLDRSRSRD